MREYEVRDPVYGFITFNDLEKDIINEPLFQRLRRIRQLGLTDMVYPGAMHTRFEHSLGAMHLATLMYNAIAEDDNNFRLLEDRMSYNKAGIDADRQLVRLAALLHDIGHAPFSHASEDIMPFNERKKRTYKHEDYSSAIIKGPLRNVIESHPVCRNYRIKADEVAALIDGDAIVLKEKIFWKVLISSQLDADRGDYLLRDSIHTGVKYGIYDHMRLLNTLSLGIDPETDYIFPGIDEGGCHVAEAIAIARYQMFTQVYFHKTRRAYDYHLEEAMKSVLDGGKLPSPGEIEEYADWDDTKVMQLIKGNRDDSNCNAVVNRDHIRMVFQTPETPTDEDEKTKNLKRQLLEDSGIWYYEDKADNVWYKLNTDEENREIMIVSKKDNEAVPLSEYSHLIKNLGEIKQIRLYVRPEDRTKAEEVLGL